ncbi:MAG: sulfite exporter TauE/SafE family protein [Hyphomicrobiaceae bacterium]
MDWVTPVLVLAGALIGGFVNGLTGFGTGLTALPLWLQVLEPVLAAQLVSVASIAGHLSSLPLLWLDIDWRRLAPMLLAGLIGVPIGLWLLPLIKVEVFKLTVGIVLIVYCGFMLWAAGRLHIHRDSAGAEMGVGFIGGILGGIAGLSGPPPIVWGTLRAWPKTQRRQTLQAFNTAILSTMLMASLAGGLVDARLVVAAAVALPATLAGNWLGDRLYRSLDDRRFDRIVLSLLFLSGFVLVWSNR